MRLLRWTRNINKVGGQYCLYVTTKLAELVKAEEADQCIYRNATNR